MFFYMHAACALFTNIYIYTRYVCVYGHVTALGRRKLGMRNNLRYDFGTCGGYKQTVGA